MMSRPSILPMLSAGGGIATFALMDGLMKSASLAAGVFAAMLWRCVIGAGLGLAVWHMAGRVVWPDRARLALHAARSAVTCCMALAFFWGLMRTPMAVGMALSFIAPIIALFMAAAMLGEPITRRALEASALGLCGVVVIGAGRLGDGAISPDSAWGMGAILCSAVLYAINLVMQRHQAQQASPGEIAFFQSMFMALLMGAAALTVPGLRALAWPPMGAWHGIAGAAMLATISLFLLSWGWARAPAHKLLPIEYTAFIWSMATGYWWFGERPGLATLMGAGLIVAGCWHGTGKSAHIEQTAL